LSAESAKAYAAFCAYRDLGPDSRSLNAAYAGGGRAPGYWAQWSSEFRWVERAAAYDAHLDDARRRVREAQLQRLEERRFAFELRNQDRIERRVERIEANLDRADQAPITDVTQVKGDGDAAIRTKVKGINLAGYARLVEVANKSAEQAVNGVRPKDERDGESAPVRVKGEFVWTPPSPTDEK
jgi:hypothetical protein